MTSSEPPVFATWLLRQFGCGPQNEAILGDLIEQYRQGRSRFWYWRQALIAIALGVFREVSQHKTRTLAAIGTAWLIFGLYFTFVSPLLNYVFLATHPNLALAQYVFSKILPRSWLTYYFWIIPVAFSLFSALLGSFGGAFTGWLMARLSASHRPSGVLLYATSVYLWRLSLHFRAILRWGSVAVLIEPGHELRGLYSFVISEMAFLIIIASILLGGGLLRPLGDMVRIPDGEE